MRLPLVIILFFSWSALAADPTAPLTLNVVPPSAFVAGFTKLALDADFSKPKYAVQSNYLTCGSFYHAPVSTEWLQDIGSSSQASMPCNINQVVDNGANGDGSTVLRLSWLPGYTGGGLPALQQMETTNIYPPNSYVEITARLQMTPDVTTDPWEDPAAYSIFWTYQNPGFENDLNENFGTGSVPFPNDTATTIHSWPANGPDARPWQAHFDVRQYHTFGMRLTGNTFDGGNEAACVDFDGVRSTMSSPDQFGNPVVNGCTTLPIQTGTVNINYAWDVTVGAICGFTFGNVSCKNPSLTRMDYFVKSVRIWVCPEWPGSNCASSPLTSKP